MRFELTGAEGRRFAVPVFRALGPRQRRMAVAARHDLPPVAYELEPGAASRPLSNGYRRREPEKTALHAVVRENLETLLEEARGRSESGYG